MVDEIPQFQEKMVGEILKEQEKSGRICAAICAAPLVFKDHGIAKDKTITLYPPKKGELEEAGKLFLFQRNPESGIPDVPTIISWSILFPARRFYNQSFAYYNGRPHVHGRVFETRLKESVIRPNSNIVKLLISPHAPINHHARIASHIPRWFEATTPLGTS